MLTGDLGDWAAVGPLEAGRCPVLFPVTNVEGMPVATKLPDCKWLCSELLELPGTAATLVDDAP